MIRYAAISIFALGLSAAVSARQPNQDALMRQLQNALQSPDAQRAMQQVINSQEIDISQYPGFNNHDCDESKLKKCEADYQCEGRDGKGNGSMAHIKGRTNNRCHVTIENSDGSTGNCYYTDETIDRMLKIYRQPKIKISEAFAMGQRMTAECKFVDAQGNPRTFDQMQPSGTNARKAR